MLEAMNFKMLPLQGRLIHHEVDGVHSTIVIFSRVTLDALLSDIVLSKSEYLETMPWEEIISRCQSKMNPGFQVSIGGAPPVLKKGKVEPITLNVVQRGGNKKVCISL
jgi:hypothetical protein